MDMTKIEKAVNREIELFCLECEHTDFAFEQGVDHYTCNACGAEFTKDQLVKAAYAKEKPAIQKDATKAISDELSKMLKKTFK
ncbi:MAG: hypothetical protein R3D71_02455 [Rickettsiales bacterium]